MRSCWLWRTALSVPAFGPLELHEPIDLWAASQRFFLHPQLLAKLTLPASLTWTKVSFQAANQALVAAQRGVYAFVVRSEFADLPPHGYVMYMGITGKEAAARTLRIRYGDYLKHQKLRRPKKRVGVHNMLTIWRDCLYFYFAPVPLGIELGIIEIALNDCLVPPFVQDDFSAEVRTAKIAAGLR
jgi:hypothetical protein